MSENAALDRITVDAGKCGGKPCIRGMRITVRRVLEILATHPHREDLFREYPFLEEEDLQQALRYAAASVDDEIKYADSFADPSAARSRIGAQSRCTSTRDRLGSSSRD